MTSPTEDVKKKMFMIMDLQEELHDQSWQSYHIETSQRLKVIHKQLQTAGLFDDPRIEHLPRRDALEEEIHLAHTKRYVDDVKSTVTMTVDEQEAFSSKYEDIYVNSATWSRAKLAAGSAIDLATAVATTGRPGIAFVRPPGHHAMPDEGCGFCIFNNVAIAAKSLLKNGHAKKVMIVDYDVHAANGTQECVEDTEGINLISIHRYEYGTFWPNMPQTGIYHNYKNTINVPLNQTGHTDSDYFAIFTLIILPTIHRIRPDVIIVSSGFDASLGDPEGSMNVTPGGFATMIRMMMNTGIPVAAVLEGGYFLEALAADAEWAVRALLGEKLPHCPIEKIHPSVAETISRIHEKYHEVTPFFRKVQQLREFFGPSKQFEKWENVEYLDYKGERTVHAPYETRGLYTPFTTEKVDGFRNKLDNILKSYENQEDVGNGESLLKTYGIEDNIFTRLIFVAPFFPFFDNSRISTEDVDFEKIQLTSEMKATSNLPFFENLPLLQL